MNIATAAANGRQSWLVSPRFIRRVVIQSQTPSANVVAGSTRSAKVRGKSNHLARTVSLMSGVARLTSTTPRATHSSPQRAHATALSCSAPSVLRMSHVEPSRTYPPHRLAPTSSANAQ